MQKKFLTNIFLLIGVNLLIKPFWILGVDRAVQNSVGNEQYGIYTNLFAFSLLFSMLLDFGINNYASSQVARFPQLVSKHFSSLTTLKLLFSGAYLLATLVAGYVYGFGREAILLLLILGVNQALAFFILFIRSHVSGLHLFKTDAVLSVIDRGLMIIFCSMMIWIAFFDVNIRHFALAQTAGYACSLFICFFVLKPHLEYFRPVFSKVLLITLVKQTYPYALLTLIMTLYTRMDVILIKKMMPDGDSENGIYAQANRLLEAANMLAAMVSSMLLPLFARMLSQKEDTTPVIRLSLTILFLPAVMLALYCHAYQAEIMSTLYTQGTYYSAEIFGIVIFAFTGLAGMYIFGTFLTARGDMKTLILIACTALAINAAMNLALIPRYGALGSAWAAVATNALTGILNFIFALKTGKFTLHRSDLIKFILFAGLFAAIVALLHQKTSALPWSAVIAGCTGIALMLMLRIQSYSSLRKSMLQMIKR